MNRRWLLGNLYHFHKKYLVLSLDAFFFCFELNISLYYLMNEISC